VHSANRIAVRVDIRHQQVRAPIKQVYGEEVSSAWNPIAAIIRHLRSMHGRGERRNAVRCSALRLLLSQSPDNDLNPVEIEPRPRQPDTGYKRPKLWVSASCPRPINL
jgi:hypothetical protein